MILPKRLCRPALALGAVFLAACGGPLNMDNFSKLKVGQPYEEVKKIIGDPASCDETLGIRTCVWGDDKKSIRIGFVSGQVMVMSAQNIK
jgi:hypothetical protein